MKIFFIISVLMLSIVSGCTSPEDYQGYDDCKTGVIDDVYRDGGQMEIYFEDGSELLTRVGENKIWWHTCKNLIGEEVEICFWYEIFGEVEIVKIS